MNDVHAHVYTPPAMIPAPMQQRLVPPQARGTMRAAAMAARHARQVREKRAQSAGSSKSFNSQDGGIRVASPVNHLAYCAPEKQFHVKKNLHLHLNMDAVTKPELPVMMTTQPTNNAPPPRVQFAVPADKPEDEQPMLIAHGRRRTSSVTLSMDSPEGAEFGEVAHDGPAELGKRTKKVKRLGKGAGGTVYLSIYLPELKLVAVKEVLVYKEEERHMVKHELHALHENLAPLGAAPHSPTRGSGGGFGSFFSANAKPTVCPYQVSFYGAYLTPAKCAVSIVMEFMDMGSLQDLVCNISIPEPVVRHAAFCCLTALEHMHNQRMIHRDIKPANILLNRKGDFKVQTDFAFRVPEPPFSCFITFFCAQVADFGLAGTLPKSASNFSEFEGTMMYMAPERITGKSYSYVSDIWSLGVSLFALATGAYPFAVDDGFFGLEEAICTDPLPPMPNRFTPECRDFMKGLIRRDPGSRFTATQALSHPFLRGYEGSAAHHDFEDLWRKMPLRPAIKPEDAAKIVQAVMDYSLRHSNEVALLSASSPSGRKASATSLHSPSPKCNVFTHFTNFLGNAGKKTASEAAHQTSHVDQLAEDCGVSRDYLLGLFHQAHAS